MLGGRQSCPDSCIRGRWEGSPKFSGFSAPTVTQPGEEGSGYRAGKLHFRPTYVFVQELALVPVVQVDELGRALLLSVCPGAHVLAARLRVDVGALAMPG